MKPFEFIVLSVFSSVLASALRAGLSKRGIMLGAIDIDDPRIRELIEKDPDKLERLIDHEQAKLDRKSRESLISNDIAKMLKDRNLLAIWISAYLDPDTRTWKHYIEKYIVNNKSRSNFFPLDESGNADKLDTQRRRQQLPPRLARNPRKKPEFTIEKRRLWAESDFRLVDRLAGEFGRQELPEKVAEAFGVTIDDALDIIRLYRQRKA